MKALLGQFSVDNREAGQPRRPSFIAFLAVGQIVPTLA